MIKRYLTGALFCLVVGGLCLSLIPSESENEIQNANETAQEAQDSEGEAIAENLPQETNRRDESTIRMGDWDRKESWHTNNRERAQYYSGKTQPEAYREEHPYGPGGIGYDPDRTTQLLRRRIYRDEQLFHHMQQRQVRDEQRMYRDEQRMYRQPRPQQYGQPCHECRNRYHNPEESQCSGGCSCYR